MYREGPNQPLDFVQDFCELVERPFCGLETWHTLQSLPDARQRRIQPSGALETGVQGFETVKTRQQHRVKIETKASTRQTSWSRSSNPAEKVSHISPECMEQVPRSGGGRSGSRELASCAIGGYFNQPLFASATGRSDRAARFVLHLSVFLSDIPRAHGLLSTSPDNQAEHSKSCYTSPYSASPHSLLRIASVAFSFYDRCIPSAAYPELKTPPANLLV